MSQRRENKNCLNTKPFILVSLLLLNLRACIIEKKNISIWSVQCAMCTCCGEASCAFVEKFFFSKMGRSSQESWIEDRFCWDFWSFDEYWIKITSQDSTFYFLQWIMGMRHYNLWFLNAFFMKGHLKVCILPSKKCNCIKGPVCKIFKEARLTRSKTLIVLCIFFCIW